MRTYMVLYKYFTLEFTMLTAAHAALQRELNI